jgi:Glycosyltransferases involved in cell wall biogenesis
MHLVSILIPNYNKANYLRETLESLLAQTYTNWECIIVDDHSTDHSWEILEEYVSKDSRFRIYKRPLDRKPGGNAARNYAFEVSKGEYVNWLDSDDVLDENNLKLKLEFLKINKEFDFSFSSIKKFEHNISNHQDIPYLKFDSISQNFAIESLKGGFWIQTGLPLFRKKYLEKFNTLFIESLQRGQEAEFFVRVLLDTNNFKLIPNSILYWRCSQNSKTYDFHNSETKYKELKDYYSRKFSFLSFKKKKQLNDDVIYFFREVFSTKIIYMKFSPEFMDLIYLCLRNRYLLSHVLLIKLMYHRLFIK